MNELIEADVPPEIGVLACLPEVGVNPASDIIHTPMYRGIDGYEHQHVPQTDLSVARQNGQTYEMDKTVYGNVCRERLVILGLVLSHPTSLTHEIC